MSTRRARLALVLAREPVRVRLYAAGAALVAILTARGILSGTEAPLWLALGAAALGVPAVESARARVTPWTPPEDPHGRHLAGD